MRHIYFLATLILSSIFHAQTIYFEYDSAGNQILRTDCLGCNTATANTDSIFKTLAEPLTDAEQYGKEIKAAPVPVKDVLNILWNQDFHSKIVKFELLPYNEFKIYETVETNQLKGNSYVLNMSRYSYGVYYLRFYFSDGSIYTRSIIKH